MNIGEHPRPAKNGDKPGAYNLATRINSSVVDPGKRLEFDQFITGYGEISSAKLRCYISGDVFQYGKESTLKNGLQVTEQILHFGRDTFSLDKGGFICHMGGAQFGDESTPFFGDRDGRFPDVITESIGPPFSYSLKTRGDVRPGDYRIDVYFTYFNGEKWQCNKETVNFKVRSFFERWATQLSILGVVVAVSALCRVIADLAGYKFLLSF